MDIKTPEGKTILERLKSLDRNSKKAMLFIIAFIVLGVVGCVGFNTTTASNAAELRAEELEKAKALDIASLEAEIELSPEGEELVAILADTLNKSTSNCELIQKVVPNTSFDTQSDKVEEALLSLSGSYSLTKQFGSEYKLADTPLYQEIVKTPTAEKVNISIGSLKYNILFDYSTAYISKDCFLNILEHTDSNYSTFESGIKRVLSTYSWIKTPLVSKSTISDLQIDLSKARGMLGEVTKEPEYEEVELEDGTVEQRETGNCTYTASYTDNFIQSVFCDLIADGIDVEQELKVEVRGKNSDTPETIITLRVIIPDVMKFIEERKYTEPSTTEIAIPSDDVVYDAMEIKELGDISSNNIKTFSLGEKQDGLLVDESIAYDSTIPISLYPSITLSAKKTESGEEFKDFFNSVAKQISDVVSSYGDFTTAEPKVEDTSGSLYYNLFNNRANISLHYYSSNSSYQSLTFSVSADKVYFDSKENLESTCKLFEKYTGIKISTDDIQTIINTGLDADVGVTLIDGDYQLKMIKGTGYSEGDSSSISVEAIINVKETEET